MGLCTQFLSVGEFGVGWTTILTAWWVCSQGSILREREFFFHLSLEVTYYSYCPILLIEAVTESTQVQGEGRLTLYLHEEWKTLEG